MKRLFVILLSFICSSTTWAQKAVVKPDKLHKPPAVPAKALTDTAAYHAVDKSVKKVITTFKTMDDSATGRINIVDTVNRSLSGKFPTLNLLERVEFAGIPNDNHLRNTYLHANCIAAKLDYPAGKKSKLIDNRYIYDYKSQCIINLSTDNTGKKKSYKMDFALLNLSADGSIKIMANDAQAQASSFTISDEYQKISGYSCRKYTKIDPGGKYEIWLTLDSSLNYSGYQEAFLCALFGSSASIPNTFVDYKKVLKGVPLKLDYFPQKQPFAQKCSITIEKINFGQSDEKVFSTDSYDVKHVETLYELMKLAKD